MPRSRVDATIAGSVSRARRRAASCACPDLLFSMIRLEMCMPQRLGPLRATLRPILFLILFVLPGLPLIGAAGIFIGHSVAATRHARAAARAPFASSPATAPHRPSCPRRPPYPPRPPRITTPCSPSPHMPRGVSLRCTAARRPPLSYLHTRIIIRSYPGAPVRATCGQRPSRPPDMPVATAPSWARPRDVTAAPCSRHSRWIEIVRRWFPGAACW